MTGASPRTATKRPAVAKSTSKSAPSIRRMAASSIHPARVGTTEKKLDSLASVRWSFHSDVAISEVDWDGTYARQSRDGDHDDDQVKEYRDQLLAGEPFPAPVAFRKVSGQLVILDGVHRLEAAIAAEKTHFPMYVIEDGEEDEIQPLLKFFNLANGKGLDKDHRIRYARELLGMGMSRSEVATTAHLDYSTVVWVADQEDADATFKMLRLDTEHVRRPKDRVRIASLRDPDSIRQFVSHLADFPKTRSDEVNAGVTAVNDKVGSARKAAFKVWSTEVGNRIKAEGKTHTSVASPRTGRITNRPKGRSINPLDELELAIANLEKFEAKKTNLRNLRSKGDRQRSEDLLGRLAQVSTSLIQDAADKVA